MAVLDLLDAPSTDVTELNWLEAFEQQITELYSGQIMTGTVMQVRSNEVLIDVGAKSEGLVNSRELDKLSKEERASLEEGVQLRVYIVRPDSPEGHPILSISRAKMEQDWEYVEQAHKDDAIFEATVTGSNRGGLIVHIGQVRAFVPSSQVASLPRQLDHNSNEYQQLVKALIGQSLRFKVLELERRRNRLILSERLAEREWRRRQKEKLLAELETGDILRGKVSSVAPFGAFVDLGGADGLLHVSELSWGRVQHPSEVVAVGDEMDVYVLNVDRERRRIGLSLKRLQPEPWSHFMAHYGVGDELDAVVTHLTSFGAFAKLVDQEIEGLIHISELSDKRVNQPSDVVQKGERVRVKILRIEAERRRLGLSLRTSDAFADEGEDILLD